MNIELISNVEKYRYEIISFDDKKWLEKIPNKSGLYFFKTNSSIDDFRKVGEPTGIKNYNIPERIISNDCLIKKELVFSQENEDSYIVYNGHSANLRKRANEHCFGGNGTACLAIAKYEKLKSKEWIFYYMEFNNFNDIKDNYKCIRIYGEQIFRFKNKWPILCSQ